MGRPKQYENRIEYIDKWQKEHYGKIMIKLPKEEIARIRAYSAYFGPNISRFVLYSCIAFAKSQTDKMTEDEKETMESFIKDFTKNYLKKDEENNSETEM